MDRLKERVTLMFLALLIMTRNFKENIRVACSYYSHFQFMKVDLLFFFLYLFRSPFSVAKHFLIDNGAKDIYTYGETPLTTFDKIASESSILPEDVVFELGCGRGKTAFWLNCFIGCKVVGVEIVPTFVQKATAIAKFLKIKGVEFRLEDMLETDLSQASVIYIYGSDFENAFICQLVERFQVLPKGTKFLTVSYPLSDYDSGDSFKIEKIVPVRFNWGVAELFVQTKV